MKNGRNAALNGGRGSGQTVRRITELYENKIADLKANFDLAIEGRDVEIMELEKENEEMKKGLGCETCQIHLEYMGLNDKINKLVKERHLLGERCNQLLKDKGDLTDKLDSLIQYNNELCDSVEKQSFKICTLENKVTKLEQQIEKMKCCEICAHGGNDFGVCYSDKPCKNKNKWELAKWVK